MLTHGHSHSRHRIYFAEFTDSRHIHNSENKRTNIAASQIHPLELFCLAFQHYGIEFIVPHSQVLGFLFNLIIVFFNVFFCFLEINVAMRSLLLVAGYGKS